MNKKNMNKTVYILGAGFSIGAGAPSQEKLVQKIFEIHANDQNAFAENTVDEFRTFMTDTLNIPIDNQNDVPLEDIFTPIDRCLLDNIAFRNLNIDKVKEIRSIIYYLIGKSLQILLQNTSKEYIDLFAKYLYEECRKRKDKNYINIDNVSVITTNWDILLDTSIQRVIDNNNNNNEKAVVDYCCYISSYREDDERVKPGLEILGGGGFNCKLLKLHGSLNWLQCPRCQRVYVDLDDKIVLNQYQNPVNCRHCDENFNREISHQLTSNIIMPTFLKNLSNPQYKLIWQNAGVELSEANKIVFIGYSLPQADYEMRQLLSRMVRTNAKIEVVAFSGHENLLNDLQFVELQKRYKVFFGDRLIEPIYHKGAKEYILENFKHDK